MARRMLPFPGQGNSSRAARRNAAREMRDEERRIERMLAAFRMSGAGFPVDQGLRTLLAACNDDRLQGMATPFANIWDVFRGFTREKAGGAVSVLALREERDHAFSAYDFLAYATEEGIAGAVMERLRELPHGVIHSFSRLGDVREPSFDDGGTPVAFAGVSMVRLKDHLHWMTAGGPVTDLAGVTREREATVREANPGAPEERIQDVLNPRAGALEGTEDVWKTYAMGLFNLSTQSHEMRMLVRDWGVTLSVFSDQFEERYAHAYGNDPGVTRMVDRAMDEIEAGRLYFEIAETAFSLPAYFAARVRFVEQVERKTALASAGPDSDRRKALKAPPDLRVAVRRVATLDRGGAGGSRGYAPPRYQVEVDGFWRRLAEGSSGRDRNGEPVEGRTWVRSHARWKDRPPRLGTVYLKTPIGHAVLRAGDAETTIG